VLFAFTGNVLGHNRFAKSNLNRFRILRFGATDLLNLKLV